MTNRTAIGRAIVLGILFGVSSAHAVTFDDGLLHVIDAANSYRAEDVLVLDGPSGATTTIHLVTGGEIGTISDDSLRLEEHSFVEISGGTIGQTLRLGDFSQAVISSGLIQIQIVVTDQANLTSG